VPGGAGGRHDPAWTMGEVMRLLPNKSRYSYCAGDTGPRLDKGQIELVEHGASFYWRRRDYPTMLVGPYATIGGARSGAVSWLDNLGIGRGPVNNAKAITVQLQLWGVVRGKSS